MRSRFGYLVVGGALLGFASAWLFLSAQSDSRVEAWPWISAEVRGDEVNVVFELPMPCYDLDRVDVDEATASVTITIYLLDGCGVDGGVPAVAHEVEETVRLASPVGDRAVVNGGCRERFAGGPCENAPVTRPR